MFTLIRPIAAFVMALLALFAAAAYGPIYAEDANLGRFNLWAAGVAAAIGFLFLGPRVGRSAGYAVFYTLQAVVLAAIVTAMIFSVRIVFIFAYRRIYREPMDAVGGFFEHTTRYLARAGDWSFLLTVAVPSAAAGIVLWAIYRVLERRRLAR